MSDWKSYEEWLEQVPEAIRSEEMWQFFGYRKALFFYDVCWRDCENLLSQPLGKTVAQQLVRSAGSIAANIEEGYGRGFAGKERLYFLRIALGSARESKGWYYRAKALLKEDVFTHRLSLVGEVIARSTAKLAKALSLDHSPAFRAIAQTARNRMFSASRGL